MRVGWRNSVTLMDSFIALGAFLSLWGSLLASQTKASVCPSSQRPGWDPSSTPVAEGSASTSVLAVFERKTRTLYSLLKTLRAPQFLSVMLSFCLEQKQVSVRCTVAVYLLVHILSVFSFAQIRCLIHTLVKFTFF